MALPNFLRQPVYRLLALTSRSIPTLDDYVAELPALGPVEPGSVDDYKRALEERIGVRIEIKELEDGRLWQWQTRLGRANEVAETHYDIRVRKVWVFVPESLKEEDPFLYIKTVYHELAHLAAGHPLRVLGAERKLWWPPKKVARRPASADLSRNEEEADHRANWSLIFGVLGDRLSHRERNYSAF
jgi:hypothetical protein